MDLKSQVFSGPMNVIWTTQFGNWTNQVVTLTAIVSINVRVGYNKVFKKKGINITMYLYQNRSMWFNPFQM